MCAMPDIRGDEEERLLASATATETAATAVIAASEISFSFILTSSVGPQSSTAVANRFDRVRHEKGRASPQTGLGIQAPNGSEAAAGRIKDGTEDRTSPCMRSRYRHRGGSRGGLTDPRSLCSSREDAQARTLGTVAGPSRRGAYAIEATREAICWPFPKPSHGPEPSTPPTQIADGRYSCVSGVCVVSSAREGRFVRSTHRCAAMA